MRTRLTLTLLLLLTLSGGSSAQVEEAEITPREMREARALVSRFEERLRATNDFGPIVDELFVGDFQERLWQAPRNSLPWHFLNPGLMGYADRAALRRYYVAAMNLYALYFRLAEEDSAVKKRAGGDEGGATAEELLSREVLDVLLADPIIGRLFREGEEASPDDEDDAEESGVIKTPQQLDAVSSTLEKANGLLRERLARRAAGVKGSPGGDGGEAKDRPYATTLRENKYGYSEGTRVIHADFSGLCVTMIEIDGRLRVLSAVVYVD